MATVKEREIMLEILGLSADISAVNKSVAISAIYHGHINSFEVSVLEKETLFKLNPTADWVHLADADVGGVWTERGSLIGLARLRNLVLSHAPQDQDQDGVPL